MGYPDDGASLYPRHSDGMNFLFIDGHVAWASRVELAGWIANAWSHPSHFLVQ